MSVYLVTGAAGFIGLHVAQRLLATGVRVVGLDDLNPYYDVELKRARLRELAAHPLFEFVELAVQDRAGLLRLFAEVRPTHVIHLAAQAGVRYSLINPQAYVDSNLVGFTAILEACRQHQVQHLVFASSSSVYGANTTLPFSEHDTTDHPLSLYAATKKANEVLAHSYASLFDLPCTGLRFFTVYGPWGRPDMALFLFTERILKGEPIDVFGAGELERDFTFVTDVAEGVVRISQQPPIKNPQWDSTQPDPATSSAPYRLYNIGNHQPVRVLRLIELLEAELGRPAIRRVLPPQPGDVQATFAAIDDLQQAVGFAPATPLEEGVRRFVAWYRAYYRV